MHCAVEYNYSHQTCICCYTRNEALFNVSIQDILCNLRLNLQPTAKFSLLLLCSNEEVLKH